MKFRPSVPCLKGAPEFGSTCTEKSLSSGSQVSVEGSTEIGQHPCGQEENADQRLHTSDYPHPAGWFEREFPRLYSSDSVSEG